MRISITSEYLTMDPTSNAAATGQRAQGRLLKLGYRTELTMSQATASISASHDRDQRQSKRGSPAAWTVAAITPAAAGVGKPTK